MTDAREALNLGPIDGKIIVGIRRIWYVRRGSIDSTAGPVELAFADRSVILFDAAPDGEALSVSQTRWVDPFAAPLSPENERYVDRAGKWTAFDVSDRSPYVVLVGAAVDGIEPHAAPSGKLVGATIRAGRAAMRVEVEADELNVDVA